jgi:hypothetical protein
MNNTEYNVHENTFDIVNMLLPEGVCDALDRTCLNLINVSDALFTRAPNKKIDYPELVTTLRIDNAISILTKKE